MKRLVGVTVVAIALSAALVGCSEDKPAVCESVDTLQTSVDNLKNVDLTSSSAVSDLQTDLSTVEGDLAAVKTDATSEFSTQIDDVDSAFSSLKSSVDAAKADPSATTLAAVGEAVSAFDGAFETLNSDVQSTC